MLLYNVQYLKARVIMSLKVFTLEVEKLHEVELDGQIGERTID